MIQVILAFLLLTAGFWFGIIAYRQTTGREKLQLTKIVGYSILCAALAVSVLISIVILF